MSLHSWWFIPYRNSQHVKQQSQKKGEKYGETELNSTIHLYSKPKCNNSVTTKGAETSKCCDIEMLLLLPFKKNSVSSFHELLDILCSISLAVVSICS